MCWIYNLACYIICCHKLDELSNGYINQRKRLENILQHSCTFCSSIFSKINFINLLLLCTSVMLYFFKGRKSHLYSLAGFFSKRIIKRNKKDQYEREHKTKRCHDTIIYTHSQHNLIFYTCIWAHNHDL